MSTQTALDQETRFQGAEYADHGALRLWLRLLTCTNLIENSIRADLRARFDCTLPRFDLMAQLERHPEGLKMGDLSKRMMVTGGNVTGIADQLSDEGLIVRESHARDGRAYLVKLTPKGRREFARMAQEHEAWVADMFSGLGAPELEALQALLGRLKTSVSAHQSPTVKAAA